MTRAELAVVLELAHSVCDDCIVSQELRGSSPQENRRVSVDVGTVAFVESMEKWKTKGKRSTKPESVLPPTKRSAGQTCLPTMEKKKDRKWSFGGILRRISSAHNNEASSNDEDITYIPGHMLSKKSTKKTSKMRSKLGKIPHRTSDSATSPRSEKFVDADDDEPESTRSYETGAERSQDCLAPYNGDFANLRSSDGSLDAAIRASRINRTKARAQAKRDRLCGNSSSDDDSHKSNQSLRFRSDENMDSIQRFDSASRRTRGARTERYIKRMYRDDSGSDSKIIKPVALPRTIDPTASQCSANFVDKPNASPRLRNERNSPPELESRYLRDMNENETHEREKLAWPSNRKSAPYNAIHGSLRSSRESVEYARQKLVPPEPPPRSSVPRIFGKAYKAPTSDYGDNRETSNCPSRSPFLWQNPDMWRFADKSKMIEEKEEHFVGSKGHRDTPMGFRDRGFYSRNDNCNSLDRGRRFNDNPALRFGGEQENYDPRPYFENASPPSNYNRSTYSLPKGVQLFSRQRLSNDRQACDKPEFSQSRQERETAKLRKSRDCASASISREAKSTENDEAERKRSSKNLEEALSELEAIYNSLRLSDDDLLERAEQRSMEEYRDKAARSAAERSLKSLTDVSSTEREERAAQRENDVRMKDDMAYRRMNPKERPSSVNGQATLSNMSYLATSPNLSLRESDYADRRGVGRRGTPDLTRDDLLFRSISHANNTLRIIEPQPPFGIPLGPVTAATESDYLHVKPTKFGQTRSLYIPKSEPDVVSDDLAFRNLRKDSTRDSSILLDNKNTDSWPLKDSSRDSNSGKKSSVFGAKKRAVRSLSADLYGIVCKENVKRNNDWYNDYIKSTQKLSFLADDSGIVEENSIDNNNLDVATESNRAEFMGIRRADESSLDINGNRPKSALQGKIQVYVPQGTSYDEALARQSSESREELEAIHENSMKIVDTETEDSSLDRRSKGSRDAKEKFDKTIDATIKLVDRVSTDNEKEIAKKSENSRKFVDAETEDSSSSCSLLGQEISEYLRLCIDLEKLLQQNAEKGDAILPKIEENNSQSEFDELEKLLIDCERGKVAATRTEEDDDRGSSRSIDRSGRSQSSENAQSSPTRASGKFDDDASSTSELGNSSSNAGSSLTDSVYDKFDQLLREVNDVPFVKPKNIFDKCPIVEGIIEDSRRISREIETDRDGDSTDENSRNSVGEQTTLEKTRAETREANDESIDSSTKPHEKLATRPSDSNVRENVRVRMGGRRESRIKEEDERPSLREGEKLDARNEINDDAYCASKENDKARTVGKLCHVTNSITAYHVVACSLFLTLLITIIVAQ